MPVYVKLSRTTRQERDRILAPVKLGLSNSRLGRLNAKIRQINHHGYGRDSPAPLMAMLYLCYSGITVD